jgi:site-specific recombinase XerD
MRSSVPGNMTMPSDNSKKDALAPVTESVLHQKEENPAYLYVASSISTDSGRRSVWQVLELAAALMTNGKQDAMSFDWASIRALHIMALLSRIQKAVSVKTSKPYSPATVNKMLSAVKGAARTAWRSGKMDAEEVRRIEDVKGIKYEVIPAGRDIEPGEVIAMFRTAATLDAPLRQRDSAMLALLYGAGMRRSEIIALDVEKYMPHTGEVRVIGAKGHKDRNLFLDGGARAALDAWLRIRGTEEGPMLWPMTRFLRLIQRRISAQCVYQRTFALYQMAGLKRLSPHDFRRTIIGDMLDSGIDLLMVQQIIGHSDSNTTKRYDRRGDRGKQKASTMVHTPYIPEGDDAE